MFFNKKPQIDTDYNQEHEKIGNTIDALCKAENYTIPHVIYNNNLSNSLSPK